MRIGYVDRVPASLFALVAANLVPLAGALWFGWDALEIFALYWSENVVVGVFTVLRILASRMPLVGALFLSAFFTVHFGLFCVVHAVFVQLLAGDERPGVEFLAAPARLLGIAIDNAHGTGLYALIAGHGVAFVTSLRNREPAGSTPDIFAPYRRVLVMHVTVLLGGLLLFVTGRGPYLLALLAAAKTGADVFTQRAEARRRAAAMPPPGI